MGTHTITLPSRMVRIACFQSMPPAISDDASMYVVTSIDMLNHSAMKLYVVHVRCDGCVGARSLLMSLHQEVIMRSRRRLQRA